MMKLPVTEINAKPIEQLLKPDDLKNLKMEKPLIISQPVRMINSANKIQQ